MRRSPPFHLPVRLLLALALLCVGVAPVGAQTISAAAPQRTMPDLVGLSSADAQTRLQRLGMTVSLDPVASTQAQGIVVAQTPAAGTVVKQGSSARLNVSNGQGSGQAQPGRSTDDQPRLRAVPDLTGLNRTGVLLALTLAGLAPGAVDSQTVEGARGGRVVAQDPRPGTQVPRGTRVGFTLARRAAQPTQPTQPDPQPQPPVRAETVTVPNLATLTQAQARTTLGRARLLLGEADSSVAGSTAPGTVFAQKPAAGEAVAPGTFVSISITRVRTVAMPSLVGRPVAEARRVLAGAGLRAGGVSEREARGTAGRVLAQSVAAGTRVRPGTAVDLTLSRAPVVAAPDTPVATQPPPRDTTPAARQDTPVTQQPAQPVDSAAARPADTLPSATPRPAEPARPMGTATVPSADADRPTRPAAEPSRAGWPREATWGLIALLVLAAGAIIYRLTRRRPPPAPHPVAVAPVPPVAGVARLRIGTGDGWESASRADGPVQRNKLQLNVRVADPAAVTVAEGAALQAARVTVRAADAGETEMVVEGGSPLRTAETVAVRMREGAPELTVDQHTPIIHGRR